MVANTQLNTATVPTSVFSTTVTLSSANIQSMYTTGIVLIAAQGANTCIMVHDVFFEYIFNTTEYVDGEVPQISYGSLNADFNPNPIMMLPNLFTTTSSEFYQTNGSDTGAVILASSGCVNTGVYISNFTANFSGGDSTAKITLTYSVITTTA
jgi:chloramphenicol O-acetyltransferase